MPETASRHTLKRPVVSFSHLIISIIIERIFFANPLLSCVPLSIRVRSASVVFGVHSSPALCSAWALHLERVSISLCSFCCFCPAAAASFHHHFSMGIIFIVVLNRHQA